MGRSICPLAVTAAMDPSGRYHAPRDRESELTTKKTFRIWAQGATDQIAHHNYLAMLLPHMKACTDPDFELEFKTMTPSVTTVHALSEFRFSREVIRAAVQAERENYDVFFMNH